MACSLQSPSDQPCLSSEEKQQDGIDRTSDLPDSILCHILSFLPTEDAVATTILSKRWVDLWTQVPVIDLPSPSISPIGGNRDVSSFVNFVFNVLHKSKAVRARNTRKFCLAWGPFPGLDVRYVRSWISEAAGRGVQLQELSLDIRCKGQLVDLTGCLFACRTLVSLKLGMDIYVDLPATVHFPCLKILQLMKVRYADEDSSRRLFSGCLVLEDLTIERMYDDNISVLDIKVTSLKRITIIKCGCRNSADMDPRCQLLITAPLLERIDLKRERYGDILIEDASNLVEANIEVFKERLNQHQFFGLFKDIANVKFLSLVCFRLAGHPPEANFPAFHNLIRLDIECWCEYWHGPIISLLECSNNLEELVYRNGIFRRVTQCDKALEGNVPKCVSMRLKSVALRCINTNPWYWTLAKYFLKNAKFLKEMKIGISFLNKETLQLLRNLSESPMASMACEIGFFLEKSGKEIHLSLNDE